MLLFVSASGQDKNSEEEYSSHSTDDRIKTVQIYKEGWNLSYPILKLNSNEKLVFSFDLLSNQAESYDYTFIHCDKDWKRSDVFTGDYIDGLPENPVEDYKSSFNTTVSYFHYNLVFPNDRVKLKLSGNYILEVYPSGNSENPVIMQRFMISEDAAGINVDFHRPQMTSDNNGNQQIDFSIDCSSLNLTDPSRNIYSFILQNGRWDNAKKNLKPDVYGDKKLNYNSLSDKNIFKGGNEFRYFDIKSIRYQSEFIKSIVFTNPNYNILLHPSENREFKPYFYSQDLNGKYYVASQEGQNGETDADYVYVYFSLPSKEKISSGNIYVSGNFNNWQFNKDNKMAYNSNNQQYECSILLKQGWYNYEYLFFNNGSNISDEMKFEGSHYETENDYTFLVYYHNPRERYDRLIAHFTANTLNKVSN
jgi:hypothetical protein